ncbi:MAG: hypothetical protein L0Y71_14825 [Gemmataceae bacterium]|nr:hypothetical protein [Gemmataceae bacterium]
MSTSGYEFTGEQNQLIGSLAGKMRFVGLFIVIVGVLYLLMALLVVLAVYRDRVPADWKAKTTEYLQKARDQLPEDARKQAEKYSLDNLPANDHLWGVAIGTGISALFYLLMGSWTRSAARSFQKIVDTKGNDIGELMSGMGALHKMYSLLYLLLMLVLLAGIVSLGFTIYKHFVA